MNEKIFIAFSNTPFDFPKIFGVSSDLEKLKRVLRIKGISFYMYKDRAEVDFDCVIFEEEDWVKKKVKQIHHGYDGNYCEVCGHELHPCESYEIGICSHCNPKEFNKTAKDLKWFK